jgi:hypothetical protein
MGDFQTRLTRILKSRRAVLYLALVGAAAAIVVAFVPERFLVPVGLLLLLIGAVLVGSAVDDESDPG